VEKIPFAFIFFDNSLKQLPPDRKQTLRMNAMNKYTVLKLGDKTQIEQEQSAIDKLVSSGYRIVREIEANSIGDARYKYENNSNNQQNNSLPITKTENPSGYLKVTSTLFLVLSVIGCLILLFLGFEASDSYDTRRFSVIYFAGAGACFLMTILVHSICKVLIFIADNAKLK
jgi:hypothetical protein